MSSIIDRKIAFATPWFGVISKQIGGESAPYYSLQMLDYVSVVAITTHSELVLVRQYRPAVERYTLELPSGHVELNETPAESARRELAEETGFNAPHLELLENLLSDSGRNENRIWCYLGQGVIATPAEFVPEPGLERVLVSLARLPELVTNGEFDHALHLAALMLVATRRGCLLPVLNSLLTAMT
jgi:ADP-ribose pyrophosphatase